MKKTTSKTDTQFTVTINIYLATKYYFWDTENVTWGYWGTSAKTPASGFSSNGWTEIKRNTDIKIGSTTTAWGGGTEADPSSKKLIGTATKTYDRGTTDSKKVFTATLDGIQDFDKWPVVTSSFTVPKLEPKLTVNLYSNYADYGTYNKTAIKGISSTSNIKVLTQEFYKSTEDEYGLNNVQNVNSLYLSRTGYTPTGYWVYKGTNVAIDQNESLSGSKLAKLLWGDSYNLTADQTVNLYVQWTIKLTLDSNGGSGGTTNVWFKYGENKFYSNEACTQEITTISIPTKAAYAFVHYYGDGSSGGDNSERYIVPGEYNDTDFASDLCTDIYKNAILYALWEFSGVKVYARTQDGFKIGTLYARKSVDDDFLPATGLYQRQNGSLVKIK